ncbi:HalD/BesD family halogenase [Saccharopolyspora mangrovi]|uniref:ArpA protein n=1 Tax=Saccharopolyspora mangrovi TaxID=3082379 RepID=A0ABU6ACA5_9PSEU|nr:arpA protein [Saccharopolyspora sp. S2-29]MEB3369161.1 arpA protein [Saccharopolyspora sp. S2-29]
MNAAVTDIVDTDRYPLADPGGPGWVRAVEQVRADLRESGCSVLRDFVAAEHREALRAECAGVADRAYYEEQTVNVYNTSPDADLPDWHPGKRTTLRGNAFVAREDIPAEHLIHRLYTDELFQHFLADCLELPQIHPLDDPLAGLVVNIVNPGKEHPWHFDTNEFAVSMLTQQPHGGGVFEYCPHIRSAESENFADVGAVISGDGGHLVRKLPLRPGDLQLFHGRYSLHRVSAVEGEVARHSAIFAYSDRPGVVGTAERTRQLFGRVTAAHGTTARTDDLLD